MRPIIVVVGARPNFMKMAPLYSELKKRNLNALLVHTGQHYDQNMSNIFFEELGYDMADCWASCMIPFDWGLQYDPRGYIFVTEMVTGIYVIQYDGDKHPDYVFPPLFNA